MKAALSISILLNVAALGGLFFEFAYRHKPAPVSIAALSSDESSTPVGALSGVNEAPHVENARLFRWSQLESTNDYRAYVANLRAAGCPEATVEDIVSGDTMRAFAFKRSQLKLDGTGGGPWSRQREAQLVASLLGKPLPAMERAFQTNQQPEQVIAALQQKADGRTQPTAMSATASHVSSTVQTAASGQMLGRAESPRYPVAFQPVSEGAAELTADQKAAIAQVQQQFVNDIGGPNQDPQDPAYLARWLKAQQNADDALRATLGAQGYMSYLLQHYYRNFQQQIVNAGGAPLVINPAQLAQ